MNASQFLPVERTSENRLRKVLKMKKVLNHSIMMHGLSTFCLCSLTQINLCPLLFNFSVLIISGQRSEQSERRPSFQARRGASKLILCIPVIVEDTVFICTFIGVRTEVVTLCLNQVCGQFCRTIAVIVADCTCKCWHWNT